MRFNTPKRKLHPNKFFILLPLCSYLEMSRIFTYYHIPSQYTLSIYHYIYPLNIPSIYTLSIYHYLYITYTLSIYHYLYITSHIPSQYTTIYIPLYYITYTLYIYPLNILYHIYHLHIPSTYTTTHIPLHIPFHLSRYIPIYTRRSRIFNNYPNIAKLH